jgi:serine/threonine-protein kinase
MEFLYGEELRNTLKREGVLPPERVVRMLSQIAIALDPAHARKLIHRDLKPDNIFLCQTRDGDTVKILDFGSVKDKADTAKKLTVMGTTIGSPYYMAPEQAQGLETLDHRADVWALAAISYECITGGVPFKGNNGPSILLEILTKEPMPASNAAKGAKYPVPPTVDKMMSAAFKKNPAMRIPSVGALADAFGRAYGLAGAHTDWAKTTQQQLGDQIEARMPDLMKAEGPTTVAEVGNKFFGNSDLVVADPFAAPPKAAGVPMPITAPGPAFPAGPGPTLDDETPAGVPKSNSFALLVALGVGGLAVVIGIVIVVVLLR